MSLKSALSQLLAGCPLRHQGSLKGPFKLLETLDLLFSTKPNAGSWHHIWQRALSFDAIQSALSEIVKWALGSITMNKASGGDGIPVELFQTLKMMLLKCCTHYASKFGKLSSVHRTGKDQFSFQSQRKAIPKNVQTTAQLQSSHMLVK